MTNNCAIRLLTIPLLLAMSAAGCSTQAVSTPAVSAGTGVSLPTPAGLPATAPDITAQLSTATQVAGTAGALFAAHAETTATAAAAGTETARPVLAEPNAPDNWSLILYESFADNTRKWPEGVDDSNPSVRQQRAVIGSQYLVTSDATQDFSSYFYPQMPNFLDFYATVDGRLVGGEPASEYGLIAGLNQATGDYYAFLINETGLWAISLHKDGSWSPIISGRSSLIASGGNHLAVLCRQNDYTFYVNHQPVAQTFDDRLTAPGKVGLFVEGSSGGSDSSIAFDNFTVLAP